MLEINHFFDPISATLTYLIVDQTSKDAIIIDPVLDYNARDAAISFESVSRLEDLLIKRSLCLRAVLETHVHADHLTGAWFLTQKFPSAKVAVSNRFKEVFPQLAPLVGLAPNEGASNYFDLFLEGDKVYDFGSIRLKVLPTPGHTPACTSYLIDGHLFVGDTIFMPDFGSGRCDFPGGSASKLFDSVVNVLYKLPDATWVYTGHDYQPGGRELAFRASIGQQKHDNVHLNEKTSKNEFVLFREGRDQSLPLPKLISQSLQVNLRGGRLPELNDLGQRLIQVPLNVVEDSNA